MKSSLFSNRSPLLDTLRAVAVTMVVLYHVATRYPVEELDLLARQFLRYGFLGVDIFYPLSGFLITRFLLTHSESGSIRTFFLRRVFRIIPLYMVAVTLFYVASRVTHYEEDALQRIWATYLFLTGWFAFFTGPDSVPYTITWSLSVEEFAYLLFGISAWLVRRSFPAVLIFFAIAPLALRVFLYAQSYENIYYFPLARLDSIASGGLVAYFLGRVRHLPLILLVSTAVSALLGQMPGAVGSAMLFTTVTLATCTVIATCETLLRNSRGRILDWAARVGLYSYFIYLFHFFVLYGLFLAVKILGIARPGFWIMGPLCMAMTFAAAWISFTWFEAPVMSFGRKLEAKSAPRRGLAEANKT